MISAGSLSSVTIDGVDNKLASTIHVNIVVRDPSINGQVLGSADRGTGIINILSTAINGTTPLHELGHMLGAPHRGPAPQISRFVPVAQSIMLDGGYNRTDFPRVENFTQGEITEFIRAYSNRGG